MNHNLFHYDTETSIPGLGILLADYYCKSYGFQGHRSEGTKDWLMIYTVSGEGSFRVDREVRICKEHDLVILSPGIPHHYVANEGRDWEILWVHFIPLPEWNTWLQLPRTAEGLIYIHINEEIAEERLERTFQRLIQDSRGSGKAEQELAKLALAEMLILIYQVSVKENRSGLLDTRIEKAIHYLTEHLANKHVLGQLALRVELSESRFSHLLKEQTGESFIELLVKLRLQRAVKLLQLTTRQIKEIAFEVGFESAYYFTRRFTRQFGISPREYRRQLP
ncbi:helix-turn-helix domain-containing protein [Paenibacillus psychroresistens]|uniref:Helix-turn-helix domain-containing protein n=1 Tax=Paenibacillus psychroresistens TaxID=1778678 RepID=A0A6B8RDF0_9BACL|nr:helix-turn-helix domain-containing protein [Paenibacillus psychroresistens]QGQ94461.1 helix-turn-helix domain-containing protein [Paenibacillus psychroresistens]